MNKTSNINLIIIIILILIIISNLFFSNKKKYKLIEGVSEQCVQPQESLDTIQSSINSIQERYLNLSVSVQNNTSNSDINLVEFTNSLTASNITEIKALKDIVKNKSMDIIAASNNLCMAPEWWTYIFFVIITHKALTNVLIKKSYIKDKFGNLSEDGIDNIRLTPLAEPANININESLLLKQQQLSAQVMDIKNKIIEGYELESNGSQKTIKLDEYISRLTQEKINLLNSLKETVLNEAINDNGILRISESNPLPKNILGIGFPGIIIGKPLIDRLVITDKIKNVIDLTSLRTRAETPQQIAGQTGQTGQSQPQQLPYETSRTIPSSSQRQVMSRLPRMSNPDTKASSFTFGQILTGGFDEIMRFLKKL